MGMPEAEASLGLRKHEPDPLRLFIAKASGISAHFMSYISIQYFFCKLIVMNITAAFIFFELRFVVYDVLLLSR
ncbi:hypothetical protein [Paenibacillus farraposensis]|uniref:hypothetical protein n=1 Tax=Paenibacillus farraposensis TaxID=2807095 RepID=UPI001E59C444|nr:hypothetical protein [Paenibacillus farraposensis]